MFPARQARRPLIGGKKVAEQWEIFDKLLREDVDRRTFIRRLAAAGVATPSVLAFLGNTAARAGGEPPYKFQKLGKLPAGEASKRPLVFNAWDFKPEVVQAYLKKFEKQFNEKVDFSVQPGDYASVMVTKFQSKSPLDFLYTQDQVSKFFTAGWIQDLSTLWNINEIRKATLPVQWQVQTYKGAVLGLPYFNSAKGVVATNELLRKKAGLSEYPKNRKELYAEARSLKRRGIAKYPLIMHWTPAFYGITQMWAGEAICRGDKLWASDLSATFSPSSEAAAVVEDWQMIYKDQLVTKANVTWQDSDRLDAFGTGKYVYLVLNGYNLYDVNNPQQSKIAGHVMSIPYAGEPWGFLDYALYSIARKDPSKSSERRVLNRAAQLVEFMGYKDATGQYVVAKEWMKQAFLGTGYPELWDDPEVIASFKKWMPDIKLKDIFKVHYEHAVPITGWLAPWYPDFNSAAQPILGKAVVGETSASSAVKQLRDTWDQLHDQYS
jgi:multiple sugar transport system substrate-binding protein